MEVDDEAEKEASPRWKGILKSALYVLRDVGIAFLIVAIIVGSLYAYSQVWPPMVVVESGSMQHSDHESFIGVIDTGDLVIVKRCPSRSDVTTWVEGRASGYSTYGDYGDVIIFKRGGIESTESIIHRAIVWIQWNRTTNNSVDIPSLDNEKWEWGPDWYTRGTNKPYNLRNDVFINHTGFKHIGQIRLRAATIIGDFERNHWDEGAYLTMGDHNSQPDTGLILHKWIVGKARGELPWFGLIKLTFFSSPNAACCKFWGDPVAPKNSWDSLAIVLGIIIALAVIDMTWGLIFPFFKKLLRPRARPEVAEEETEFSEEE